MNICHDRHTAGADDLLERGSAFNIGARHPDDIDAGILAAANLVDRRLGIFGCVFVIVCTVTGASPPTGTLPTMI